MRADKISKLSLCASKVLFLYSRKRTRDRSFFIRLFSTFSNAGNMRINDEIFVGWRIFYRTLELKFSRLLKHASLKGNITYLFHTTIKRSYIRLRSRKWEMLMSAYSHHCLIKNAFILYRITYILQILFLEI